MGLRIFSVKKDGSYHEVPAVRESFNMDDGAFLVIDRLDKKIYIYRKTGISSALAYSAGRAATNFKTRKGSKYKIVNIEAEDKDRMLTEIIDKLETHTQTTEVKPSLEKKVAASNSYVYGEKIVPVQQMEESIPSPETMKIKKEIQKEEIASSSEILERIKLYDVEEIVKT